MNLKYEMKYIHAHKSNSLPSMGHIHTNETNNWPICDLRKDVNKHRKSSLSSSLLIYENCGKSSCNGRGTETHYCT